MNPGDVQLIEQIQQATQGASRLLCTLARRGKALERDEPQRAAFLLTALRTHPLYKGGRLGFDMLEIEDVMLDDSPLEPMSTREVIQVLTAGAHRLAETLMRMGTRTQGGRAPASIDNDVLAARVRARDGGADDRSTPLMPRVSLGPTDGVTSLADMAAADDERRDARQRDFDLQASDYLYDYVVLGFLDVLGRLRASPP